MPAPLSGPGVGLPPNQQFYPTQLPNAPADFSPNRVGLAGGQMIVLPCGDWYVSLGMYCVLQFFDQVSNSWVIGASGGWECGLMFVKSDGFNVRVANLTGCPVGAVVSSPTTQGGWVQATTTIATVGGGGSLWTPIVGGALAVAGTLVTAQAGAGYGIAPMVFIPPPPGPANNANGVGGLPAHAIAFISSGTVSSITLTNQGAGYPSQGSTFTLALIPQPFDPNLSTGITAATLTYSIAGSGSITGVICTNSGAPLAAFNPGLTLTASGAGTNSTLVPIIMQSVVSATLSAGTGIAGASAMVTTVGGNPSLGSLGSTPEFNKMAFKPRPAQISVVTASSTVAAQAGVVIDGGLFEGVPTPLFILGSAASGSLAWPTITLTMGTNPDFVHIQAAP